MNNSNPYYSKPDEVVVEHNGKPDSLPCQRIRLDYPEQQGRGEAALGRTRNGDIYAAVIAAISFGSTETKLAQRMFQSMDDGLTWTSRPIRMPDKHQVAGFTVLDDDSFLVASGAGMNGDKTHMSINRSTDRGKTWKQISVISADPYENIGEGFLSLTQLSSGAILLPVCRWNSVPEGCGTLPDFPHHVFRSIDGGVTWQGGDPNGKMATPCGDGPDAVYSGLGGTFPGCCEAHVLELETGGLLAALRYSGRQLDWHSAIAERWGGKTDVPDNIGRIFKHVFLSDSDDEGRTWKNLRPLIDANGKPMLAFGQCHGQLVQLQDGRVALVHDHRYPAVSIETLGRISEDGGKTWSRDSYHLLRGAGYAASVALEDGTIVTVTGATRFNPDSEPIEPWSTQVIRWKPRAS